MFVVLFAGGYTAKSVAISFTFQIERQGLVPTLLRHKLKNRAKSGQDTAEILHMATLTMCLHVRQLIKI